MPELSLAKTSSRSFSFAADQTGVVRQLVGHTIAEVECELIVETLKDQRGSRTASAKLLGISIRTLRNKIREYKAHGKILPKPNAN
jgi:DNA-binding NtrC family response regulator